MLLSYKYIFDIDKNDILYYKSCMLLKMFMGNIKLPRVESQFGVGLNVYGRPYNLLHRGHIT